MHWRKHGSYTSCLTPQMKILRRQMCLGFTFSFVLCVEKGFVQQNKCPIKMFKLCFIYWKRFELPFVLHLKSISFSRLSTSIVEMKKIKSAPSSSPQGNDMGKKHYVILYHKCYSQGLSQVKGNGTGSSEPWGIRIELAPYCIGKLMYIWVYT